MRCRRAPRCKRGADAHPLEPRPDRQEGEDDGGRGGGGLRPDPHVDRRSKDLADADLVVEAVVENAAVKEELFRELDGVVRTDAILATNTSSISITKLAAATKRPDQVIGMHFMNPVPMMKLVEVIRGQDTSDETTREGRRTSRRRIGKTPVEVNDYPGFVSNRVLMPMINEAIFCLDGGRRAPRRRSTR